MPPTPTMQMRYDENSIPVSAKCSMCGKQMPQGEPRLTNPIENVAWFTAQFDIHLLESHPPDPRKALHAGNKKSVNPI
jgi:hypothetical protein